MTDPHNPVEIGVSIKIPESKKWAGDDPWFTYKGTSNEAVKQAIGESFGIETEDLTLADVVVNAERIAIQLGTLMQGLGGTVLATTPKSQPKSIPAAVETEAQADVWAAASGTQAEPAPPWNTEPQAEVDPILAAIEGSRTVAEVQQVWAENQAAFNANPAYMEAYKAKGKALS